MLPCHPHSTVGTGSSPVRSAESLTEMWGFVVNNRLFSLYKSKSLHRINIRCRDFLYLFLKPFQ